MARPYPGILYASLACLAVALLVWVLAVTGMLFSKPTPPGDLGLSSVTIVLVGFGLAGLLLRRAKLSSAQGSRAF